MWHGGFVDAVCVFCWQTKLKWFLGAPYAGHFTGFHSCFATVLILQFQKSLLCLTFWLGGRFPFMGLLTWCTILTPLRGWKYLSIDYKRLQHLYNTLCTSPAWGLTLVIVSCKGLFLKCHTQFCLVSSYLSRFQRGKFLATIFSPCSCALLLNLYM